MRYLIAFFVFTFSSSTSQDKFYLEMANGVILNEDKIKIHCDKFNNCYQLHNQKLIKNNNERFDSITIGEITKIDFYNPMEIKIWYEKFNLLILLDNKLNEILRLDFSKLIDNLEITNISNSNKNYIWIFDENNNEILKYDFFKKRILNNIKIKISGKLYDIISDYNSLWILTSNELIKVNYNGLLDYKIPNSDNYNKIRFFEKNILLASNNSIGYLDKKELKINLFKIPKLFIKDFFVINESLYIYEEDFFNKFLIKKN
tara:strand:+ start:1067 stop:1846 length:780 start_codon:yes stop_codon:yes gene_type:complete